MGKQPDPRKRRTREHVLADLSVNHVERFVFECGFTAEEPKDDYGYDLRMFTCDPRGYTEEGAVYFQLKATDAIRTVRGGVVFDLDVRDHNLWMAELMPVFLVVYDAPGRVGYWLYIQNYFAADQAHRPKPGRRTVRVTIPRTNVVDESFIRYARDRKADVYAQAVRRVDHRA
ncbi:MAG: DUF4365 domain-containing protein [Gemmataceae bacterium]|nr:DUF4365 domain-containing protein [Gemmataceae bacterium]